MMIQLRRAVSYYLIALALFVVADYLGFWEGSGPTHSALLAVLAAGATMLAVPGTSRVKLTAWLAGWLVVYGLLLWLMSRLTLPIWSLAGHELQVTIEAGFVLAGAWLAHRMGMGAHVLEAAVGKIALGDSGRLVATMEQAADNIGREFARSRRYHYPLSVVVLELDPKTVSANLSRVVLQLQRSTAMHFVLGKLSSFIHDSLRRTDLIIDPQAEGRLLLLTPDTDLKSAQQLAARIQAVAADRFHVQMTYASATFPDDAVSFDELVALAQERLAAQSLPAGPTVPVELAAPEKREQHG